jgi:Zn finger protein HypA/HybF involved in hydrogenase expression
LYCLDCQITYEPSRQEMSCPSCGSINIRIKTGEEFFLEAIDVDNQP